MLTRMRLARWTIHFIIVMIRWTGLAQVVDWSAFHHSTSKSELCGSHNADGEPHHADEEALRQKKDDQDDESEDSRAVPSSTALERQSCPA